ncbi:MAG: DNA replication and repair protein RecF [Paracoccaceae bacterium]|jgi:DNA replication and repair protein RecF
MTGLAVHALSLLHVRSHRATRLILDARPVAVYGPNGAGKTNLIEAVSLLSPGRGLRRASADDLKRKADIDGWKINAEIISLGRKHEISTWSQNGASRSVTIDAKTAPQTALGRIARVIWLVPAMDRLWTEAADGRRRFLDRMVLSFEPSHADAVLTYEKAMRERNRLLKDMVRDPAWYRALEAQMATSGAIISSNRSRVLARIAVAQDNAKTAFPAAHLALEGPNEVFPVLEADLLAAFADGRRTDLRAGRTLEGPHRVDLKAVYQAKDIAAKDCSTGEQKALLVSLILANARALSEDFGAAPLLLLDEVAAHLDAGRRAALYDEICVLGAQAWMTGTEASLFAELGARAQRLAVTEGPDGSQVRPVSGSGV